MWFVRSDIFASNIYSEFAVKTATVKTLSNESKHTLKQLVSVQSNFDVKNMAKGAVYAKPMQRALPLGQSHLKGAIEPPQRPVGLTLYAPGGYKADGHLAPFNIRNYTGLDVAVVSFPDVQPFNSE
ncbi:hypothetical protein NUW58_g1730 [Xylaria curta]|uniref:Uncharacterized protein n=1 Tax=Xylaria curta TaxID=42375 RepID=A0ACC1PLF9_9PEZI|nr:hypothetical protein NUW58_g1730 [Xylaria curta]